MLFLLRKVRKKLMKESKFTTYLLYAIGEIILVVAGILIAISIDNLNDRNKEFKREREVIKSLQLEFKENLNILRIDIGRLDTVIQSCNYLYENIGPDYIEGSINVDSVLSHTFSFPIWDPSDFVLNDIKNSGLLSSMSDSTLKASLIDWQQFFTNLENWHSFYELRSNKYFDYILENGNTKNINKYIPGVPIEYESGFKRSNQELMRKVIFENSLADKLFISKFVQDWYHQTIPKIEFVISACEKANNNN